ncbi:MAG: HsdR family type I site-specific deoxyribonuclease [Erysipelotrichaceae bacterium]
MREEQFETELIKYIENISGTKQWHYEKEIRSTDALWNNFKQILEQHNQRTLNHTLSVVEFNQVKKIISSINTPYEAGQFLYGLNGVSQIEINLDDGRHVYLTVFDQKQVGAGDTVYQVVNQIVRPAVISGKENRRFDTTLLINGLPIIQIEEKNDKRDINEALNQMHQYIDENQYRDIFSTLQILVAISPNNVKYMANTTTDKFNKDFAFNWQRKEDNQIVRNWKEFASSMLSIPMAHQMATNYMILDGTKNKQMLKVMRPYQVYATQKVIEGIKNVDFESGNNKIGYVWHTTGSGKTITSFKTAWLASRMPKVDKVVFVVDRIALTKQTNDNYKAYDPDGSVGEESKPGSVQGTFSTNDLNRKLKNKDNSIIVTSVQKLGTLVNRKNYKAPDKHIVFIVDEAHRSTAGNNFSMIQNAFKKSAWVGYTGTPMFDETTTGLRTEDIFGKLLHAYTIREAISDRNVLPFNVDFETTINEQDMKTKYLPQFYKTRNPQWTDEQIAVKINNLTDEDIDDSIEPSFYDENQEHVKIVVEDIFKNWRNRSNEGRYNALFTTHVGGGRASTPMAMSYYREFQRVNEENKKNGKQTLKVAITFSSNTSNNDTQLETNKALYEAMNTYNNEFNTRFGMDDVSGYTQDVTSRLRRTTMDKNYLDLVIVVDQLLTGFDAPEMNTLYVDRTLRGANLIQAYSRTNRIADMQEKPWGRIVNYRWPVQNEKLMNEALAIYANKNSALLSAQEQRESNIEEGIITKTFETVFGEVKNIVEKLEIMTDSFQSIPKSEKKREEMFELLKDYNMGMSKLKQYKPGTINGNEIGFNYDNPDDLIDALGMTSDQEIKLTTVLSNELKHAISKEKNIPFYQIELRMTHVKDVKIDYDYLTELIERLLNQVHDKDNKATETKDKIVQFANGLDDRNYAIKIVNAAKAIFNEFYIANNYPVKLNESEQVILDANNVSLDRRFQDFRIKWGIIDIITSENMRELFSRHRYGLQDLDDTGYIREVISKATVNYKTLSHDEKIQALSKMKYRNALREALYELADALVEV